jgi:AraC-like DNA-binding protein
MLEEANANQIKAHDVVELNEAVDPWQLRMQQLSLGGLRAQISFAPVNSILVSHERWSKKIFAVGSPPPGYLMIAGLCSPKTFLWCGSRINSRQLACGLSTAEIEFLTPDGANHWVILVPVDKLTHYLGEELAAATPLNQNALQCLPEHSNKLRSLVDYILGRFNADEQFSGNTLLLNNLEHELLFNITEVLSFSQASKGCQTARKRYAACRKAALYAEQLRGPIRLSELAAATGTSVRVLQLGFKETFGLSPGRFLRWNRLNRLHQALREPHKPSTKVTSIMEQYGFYEFGRTSVEYRNIFGQHPSQTLVNAVSKPLVRLDDALGLQGAQPGQ